MVGEPDVVRRVLFISHWFPRRESDWNGVFVHEQAKVLCERGIEVRVLVGEPMADMAWKRPASIAGGIRALMRAKQPEWQTMRGVEFALVPFVTPHPRLWGAMAPHAYVASLRRFHRALISGFAPQIVHAHTAFLDGHAAAWLARRLAVPLVVTDGTGPFTTLTRTAAQRRLTQAAVNAADLVLPVSAFHRREMARALWLSPTLDVQVLGNGFDTNMFAPSPMPAQSPPRLLWIGRLDENKRPLLVLDAFAQALEAVPDLGLTLIGDGDLANAVGLRLQQAPWVGKVVWRRSDSRAGIAAAMRDHHGLVITSRVETFGVVAIEALGSGRPVLSTNCGGPEEIIAATGGGEIVAGSSAVLAAGMVRMVAAAALIDPSVLAKAAGERYSYAALASTLCDHYRDVVARRDAS